MGERDISYESVTPCPTLASLAVVPELANDCRQHMVCKQEVSCFLNKDQVLEKRA